MILHLECNVKDDIQTLETEVARLKKETFNVSTLKLKSPAEKRLLQSIIDGLDNG
jgi:hypothetical protein